jgi:hypothetical protein
MPEKTNGRTEEKGLFQLPEKVRLGDQEYEIRPLTINEQIKWRELFYQKLRLVARGFTPPRRTILSLFRREDETAAFTRAMHLAFIEFPGFVADLFFAYAPRLPRREIEARATEVQLVVAFNSVMKMGFPFFDLLQTVLALSQVTKAALQPERPTSSPSTSGASRPST